ncbi:MAG TPA: hypothetical protein VML19_25240 [Verrucomicrobiae bacterium]|nr:hypothetical protein [Verrucomicrobiae bacterium]
MKQKKTSAPVKAAPAKAATPAWDWRPWAWAAAAVVLVFWAYGPSLHGAFLFDDTAQPYAKPSPADVSWWIHLPRPVLMLTYWLNRQLAGDSTYGYHVVNVLIHLVATGLMFLIVRRFLELANSEPSHRNLLAGFAAALFLLHPAMSEAVAYISGRSESLSTMWSLAALAVFLYRPKPAAGWGTVIAVFLLFGLSVESKQQTVVLPALFVLTDLFWNPVLPGGGFSLKGIRGNWKLYAPMAAGAILVVIAARDLILHGGGAGFGLTTTWYQYLFTEFRALLVYIQEFLLPINLNGDWVFPISKNLFEHGAVIALAVLLALVAAAILYRKRFRLASFGLIAYLLLMAPTSSILPIADPLAERRLYFSVLGLILIAVDLVGRLKLDQKSLWLAFATIVAACMIATHARAAVWDDDNAFWADVMAKAPDNARGHFHVGFEQAESEHWADAVSEYQSAWNLGYREADLLLDWSIAYQHLNQPDKGLEKALEAVQKEDGAMERVQVATVYASMQRYQEALDTLDAAQKRDENYPYTYLTRGQIHFTTQNCAAAVTDFRNTLTHSLAGEPAHDLATQYLPKAQACAGTH